MAAVIHTLWEREDRGVLILPGMLPVDEAAVRWELTRYLDDNWQPVLTGDVDGPGSRALDLDRRNPNLGRYSACRRVARTLYLGSAPTVASARRGLDDRSVKLGCVQPGESVLVQGTGGVSLFALQFAKLAGARVILTSSSDDKLARGRALGADETINYKQVPEWGKMARALTGGAGCDHIVEVGGAGTLNQSIRAVRVGGTISMIGVLAGPSHDLNIPLIVMQNLRLQGVTVGSRDQMEEMCRAVALGKLKPVIDKVFPFAEAKAAFAHMASGQHFGKVAISLE